MSISTPVHRFDFVVYFEKEGGLFSRQRVENFSVTAETGMAAWVEVLNRYVFETNTARLVKVEMKVTPYIGSSANGNGNVNTV